MVSRLTCKTVFSPTSDVAKAFSFQDKQDSAKKRFDIAIVPWENR